MPRGAGRESAKAAAGVGGGRLRHLTRSSRFGRACQGNPRSCAGGWPGRETIRTKDRGQRTQRGRRAGEPFSAFIVVPCTLSFARCRLGSGSSPSVSTRRRRRSPAVAAADRLPGGDVDRVLDELHAAVAEQRVDPAGVPAPRGDVQREVAPGRVRRGAVRQAAPAVGLLVVGRPAVVVHAVARRPDSSSSTPRVVWKPGGDAARQSDA